MGRVQHADPCRVVRTHHLPSIESISVLRTEHIPEALVRRWELLGGSKVQAQRVKQMGKVRATRVALRRCGRVLFRLRTAPLRTKD